MTKCSTALLSAYPMQPVADEKFGSRDANHDRGLDELHHGEGNLIEHLQTAAADEQHSDEEADDHGGDRIVAREKSDQDAGEPVALRERLRQSPFLRGSD